MGKASYKFWTKAQSLVLFKEWGFSSGDRPQIFQLTKQLTLIKPTWFKFKDTTSEVPTYIIHYHID